MIRIPFDSEPTWLAEKLNHLSASEASIPVGQNPWGDIDTLYDIKIGDREPRDISEEPQIVFGKQSEPIGRAEFSLLFPEYRMDYHGYDILCHDKYPFISATLDAELTYQGAPRQLRSPTGYIGTLSDGDLGVWEYKTATVRCNDDLAKWDDRIPDYYFTQVLQQLFVTRWKFNILTAKIVRFDGRYVNGEWVDNPFPTIFTNNYIFFYADPMVRTEMVNVIQHGIRFWKCVQSRVRPDLIIKPLRF